jgi:hypothetical protein
MPSVTMESEWLRSWLSDHGGVLTVEKRFVVVG